MTSDDAFHELCAHTLGLRDAAFIHQHVVDAYAAQTATSATKPITLAFALTGLCLRLDPGFTGRAVQRAHMRLAARKRVWPTFTLQIDRGALTAAEVPATAPGAERAQAIDAWCAAVWAAYGASHAAVAEFLRARGIA